jgi:hypothetical protein
MSTPRDPLDPLDLDNPDHVHSAMREALLQCCLWIVAGIAVVVFVFLLTLHLLSSH